jgi:hypothetical protein
MKKRISSIPMQAMRTEFTINTGQYFFGTSATPNKRPMY